MNKILSSTASTKTSLEAIRNGEAGLNEKRKNIYLSAATYHEFALLRGKTKDIIVHGVERHCHFNEELLDLLQTKKLRLIAHTHSDYGKIKPSADDREFLKHIDQKSSVIISYITGAEFEFGSNSFEEF